MHFYCSTTLFLTCDQFWAGSVKPVLTWGECQQSHLSTWVKGQKWNAKEKTKQKIPIFVLFWRCIRVHRHVALWGHKWGSQTHHRLLQSVIVTSDLKWTCPLALTFDFRPPHSSERMQRSWVQHSVCMPSN